MPANTSPVDAPGSVSSSPEVAVSGSAVALPSSVVSFPAEPSSLPSGTVALPVWFPAAVESTTTTGSMRLRTVRKDVPVVAKVTSTWLPNTEESKPPPYMTSNVSARSWAHSSVSQSSGAGSEGASHP